MLTADRQYTQYSTGLNTPPCLRYNHYRLFTFLTLQFAVAASRISEGALAVHGRTYSNRQ